MAIFLAIAGAAAAQNLVTLEQASSRSGKDMTAAYEGRPIAVNGEIDSAPVWALGTYYLAIRDTAGQGLILSGGIEQFRGFEPGDRIEASGTIQSRAAMPLLAVKSIQKISHEAAPQPQDVTIADLNGFRLLGLLVRTTATVDGVAENLGGESLSVTDRGNTIAVFLPRSQDPDEPVLKRVRTGDRVELTGLATQYSLEAPHDGGFQLLLASPRDIQVIQGSWTPPSLLIAGAIGAIALLAALWWIRERRLGVNRRTLRALHALSEDLIAAASPPEIAEKLAAVLPTVTQATGVRLYLADRRNRSLERVPTKAEPDPMAAPIDAPPDGLAGAAVVCFRNRTLLNVPDVRRSPFVKTEVSTGLRSAMFLPLLAQHDAMGVLEVGNARRMGFFTLEEQAAAQHLANQVAAALKLQEQRTIREQLFRSEKLAATGQLISGVASELRAPLDSILQLATSLANQAGQPLPERDVKRLAGESQRASEIVSRLVSFARPEESMDGEVDVNALLASLIQFRAPEWKTLRLRVQNRVAPEPAPVAGSQSQIEQVLLNLLVHAEQCAADSPGKTITIASSRIAGRVTIEIGYPAPEKPEEGDGIEAGLGVCQGIVRSHGGELRMGANSGMSGFEIDLPVTRGDESASLLRRSQEPGHALTILLVDSDPGAQRQMMGLLSARGHRVIPAPVEEAADLAQRLRFDAVFWAMRPASSPSVEIQSRLRAHVPAFVLVSEGYDAELARSLEPSGFLLPRPVQETALDEILKEIGSHAPGASAARGFN